MSALVTTTRHVQVAVAAAFIVFNAASSAFAQTVDVGPTASPTPANGTEPEVDRVIITGSHIPTAEEVGPNPVVDITEDEIRNSGERTAAEIIRDLPQNGFAGVPPQNNGFGDFGPAGTASVALRGFDASSTLTLLDGRRLAPFPLGAPPTFSVSFVDLNTIPKGALGAVEVLPDSASAIYGADAVAGVVNIKFRHDFKGAEVSTSYGNTLDTDSAEQTDSVIFGVGDTLTNITGVFDHYQRNGLFDRDRDYSSVAPVLSTFASPWNLQLTRAAVLAAGVPPSALPPTRVFYGQPPPLTDGTAPPATYTYRRFALGNYNVNLDAQAIPESDRYGGFISATRKIFGDQLQVYGDFSYQESDTFYVLSPTASGFFQSPGQTTLAIPPHAPGPVIAGPSYAATGVPFGAYNPFNPFQQIISGRSRARLADFGDRLIDADTIARFGTLGVKGDKLFGGDWGYDAGVRVSNVDATQDFHGVSASRFNRIMNAADPIFDPNSSQYIGTTTPYNPFGDYRRPIASNRSSIDFASIDTEENDTSYLETADFNIYTTSLFELPAGGVGLAIGGQFRNENIDLNPDPLQLRGDLLGQTAAENITASREAYAFYGEATVPIVSSVHPLPLVRSLEFTGAARFEDFLNNNTNVLVPKVGMRWQPFDESLTIRATWGEGFHQPSLLELFAQTSGGTYAPNFAGTLIVDPLTHQPAGEFDYIVRGNPGLQPEDSRAFSAGFVYTPTFHKNLTVAVTLYDVESTGRAFIPELQDVIDRSVGGHPLPFERVTRDEDGNIIYVEMAYQNAGSRKARGADFSVGYELETPFGAFSSSTQATFLDSLQFAQTSDAQEAELVRSALGSSAALQWKGNSRLDWRWRGFNLGATAFYNDGFHEYISKRPLVTHWVSQTWLFDVRAAYTFEAAKDAVQSTVADESGKQVLTGDAEATRRAAPRWQRFLDGTTISVGCNNVFDHDPPHALNMLNYPSALYDPSGRFVYVRLTKNFF